MTRTSTSLARFALPLSLAGFLTGACEKGGSKTNPQDESSDENDQSSGSQSNDSDDSATNDTQDPETSQTTGTSQTDSDDGNETGNSSSSSEQDTGTESDDDSTNEDSTSTETTTDSSSSTDPGGDDGGDETTPIVKIMPPSFDPPGGLKPEQVPQFIVFGFDDNRYADGMQWVLDTFEKYKNPKGSGNPKNHDGQPARITFYFTTDSLEMGEAGIEAQWQRVVANRHEVGNHTHTHRALENMTPWSWTEELGHSNQILSEFFDIDVNDVLGVRAPFLQHDAALFD